jgi:hypothetical protein
MRKILVVVSIFWATFVMIGHGWCQNSDGREAEETYHKFAEINMQSVGIKGDPRNISLYYDRHGNLYHAQLEGVIAGGEKTMKLVSPDDEIRNVVFLDRGRYIWFNGPDGSLQMLPNDWYNTEPGGKIYYYNRPWNRRFFKLSEDGERWEGIREYMYGAPMSSTCDYPLSPQHVFENLIQTTAPQSEDPQHKLHGTLHKDPRHKLHGTLHKDPRHKLSKLRKLCMDSRRELNTLDTLDTLTKLYKKLRHKLRRLPKDS